MANTLETRAEAPRPWDNGLVMKVRNVVVRFYHFVATTFIHAVFS
jgi:hypothetical protein